MKGKTMNIFEYFSDFKDENYFLNKEKYDDLFIAIADYLFRANACGIDIYEYNVDGVSGQEIKFKNLMCEKLFLLFVFLNSNGYYRNYIIDCLDCEFIFLSNYNHSVELVFFYKLLLFVEKELAFGYKEVLKKVIEMSAHYCNDVAYSFCIGRYKLMK